MAPRKKSEVDELEIEDDFDVEEDEEETAAKKGKKKSKKAEDKGVGARQIAEELGVDAKTFRAWLRRKIADGSIELDHEHKSRYSFGNTINSPAAKRVMKLWNEDDHERGRKKKEADDEDE